MTSPHVLIVGGGIVGTSLAYHLASKNARVTLLDQATHPASGVTQTSFGWLTVSPDSPDHYLALRQLAIADWHRIEQELKGQLIINWSGALRWWQTPTATEQAVSRLNNVGYPVLLINQQQLRQLEPNLKSAPSVALFAHQEGAIDAKSTTNLLTLASRQAGAIIRSGNPVLSLMTDGSRVTGVVTASGKIYADQVVLATGMGTTSLCQPLGVNLPITVSPAALLSFEHAHSFVHRVVSSPLLELRPASGGLTLAAEDCVNEPTEASLDALAHRSLATIKQSWLGTDAVEVRSVRVGRRAMPQDGLPLVGRLGSMAGLYILVMHAGVTLASVMGRLAAEELLSDGEDRRLSFYRPLRAC